MTSWIINSGSEKGIWDELKQRYQQFNDPHVYQLRKELVTTSQGTLLVESYYAKNHFNMATTT